MWSNFKKIEKIASITLGLLALVGITAYFSGDANGQQIFSIAIMLIFVIIGIIVFIPMIKRKAQYYDFNTSQNYQQYQNKNEGRQKTQNKDSFEYEEKIWLSKKKDERERLCSTLHIPEECANKSLYDLLEGYRSLLIDTLQEQTNTGRYSEENKRRDREKDEQRQREEEHRTREEESRQRENRNRQKEKKHEQKENYSKQNNSNSEILEHYRTLGLEPGASNQQIDDAHDKLSLKLHPDKNNIKDFEFFNKHQARLNNARDFLKNQNP